MVQMLRSRSTTDSEVELSVGEVCANGLCMKTTEVEAKLDEGNIEEAESSLREGLSLNFEVASSLHSYSSFCISFTGPSIPCVINHPID